MIVQFLKWVLLVVGGVTIIVGCDGSDGDPRPADSGKGDLGVGIDLTLDTVQIVDVPRDEFVWPDVGPDAPYPDLPPPDLVPWPSCSLWMDWYGSCLQVGQMGCQSTCKDDQGVFRGLSCQDDGSCSCKIGGSTTSCTAVTPSSTFCQTCFNAVTSGCCTP